MSRSEIELLNDARIAIERIFRYTAGLMFDDYLQSDKDQSAVERQFEILSEALKAAAEQNPRHLNRSCLTWADWLECATFSPFVITR